MNRIDKLFARKKKDVLAVYFTAGFPALNDTLPVAEALQENGVDLIEIGMPFSDPLADGPVIQESSRVALENGMSLSFLFSLLENAREKISVPLVLMGYLNPVLQFGVERFLVQCEKCGIDGVILPDLPPEVFEKEYKTAFEKHGVHFIFLITSRTPADRIRQLASLGKGFLYLVSSPATTGTKKVFTEEQQNALKQIATQDIPLPLLTGFGIHDYETLRAASQFTNGAITGSAFIRSLSEEKEINKAVQLFLNRLKPERHDHPVA